MRLSCFVSIALAVTATSLSAATLLRYRDAVFTGITTTSNIVYGSNVNADGTTQTLRLDLYQPSGDTAQARPVVLFFFGGGFAVGTKTDGDMVLLSQSFAKRGYVAASVQYRLDTSLTNSKPLIPLDIAQFRAVQDAKAAVRFLRAHKTDYKIDGNRVILGGCSAGGVIGLWTAFLDANEIPSGIDTNKVGGLEGNSGTPGVSSAINGVINCWGCIQDSMWLYNNKIPVINFAGTADPLVAYDHSGACAGSACVYRVLTRLGVYSVLKPFVGMGHGMGATDPRYDTLITMAAQFSYDILYGGQSSVGQIDISYKRDRQGHDQAPYAVFRPCALRNQNEAVFTVTGRLLRAYANRKTGSEDLGEYIYKTEAKQLR